MNSRFLYAATVTVALISGTLAMADAAPVTQARVDAQTAQTIAKHKA